MKSKKNIYSQIYNMNNLILAWKKARKGKTKKGYVIRFEKNLGKNLRKLRFELMSLTYQPRPLKSFILRDPKTRKISKSDFRDRIIHHALCKILEPIFDKIFIYDSCANRKNKGNLFAIGRFDKFKRKVTNNLKSNGFCFKADIKHYFKEVNQEILIEIIKKRIYDKKVIGLIRQILKNFDNKQKGMPLGNLTSQFFANVYLNELDYFIKHKLKVKHYVRYVDDFVILHSSDEQLKMWVVDIHKFLIEKLKLELHPDKSRIISLSEGVDFVGFRNFYHHKLLRKRNIKNMENKIKLFKSHNLSSNKLIESYQGWVAYSKWADSFNLRKNLITYLSNQLSFSLI